MSSTFLFHSHCPFHLCLLHRDPQQRRFQYITLPLHRDYCSFRSVGQKVVYHSSAVCTYSSWALLAKNPGWPQQLFRYSYQIPWIFSHFQDLSSNQDLYHLLARSLFCCTSFLSTTPKPQASQFKPSVISILNCGFCLICLKIGIPRTNHFYNRCSKDLKSDCTCSWQIAKFYLKVQTLGFWHTVLLHTCT